MSQIWITGDIHGDVRRFSTNIFPEQKEMTKDDYVIITGDFGLIWEGTKEEKYWIKWLDNKPFTTLFVDGNHENFNLLDEYEVVDFCGGKAHKISEHIYHLMRGYVFTIGGKKIFAFGGARSHDIQDGILDRDDFQNDEDYLKEYKRLYKSGAFFRVKGVSWWPEELPSEEEMQRGIENLQKVNNDVDFIITHCAPQEFQVALGFYDRDILTMYLNDIAQNTKFKHWFCGHYHGNKNYMLKFHCIYEQIERIN